MFWQETFPNNVVLTELCGYYWLLLYRLIMKRNKPSKEKYKMYNLRRKGAPGSGIELTPVFKGINRFKILNEYRVETSMQDPTQLSFHLVRRN